MNDDIYMLRCIQLAKNGIVGAAPNPMVGAVIVHNDRIIGEGWHRKCGGPHAEVNAVRSVRPEDEALLPESTIYVSLEPCSHWGRTPPCAELLVEKGFRRVVIGCQDPFAEVQGRGIRRLREAGIEVKVGVQEKACQHLNRRFITFHTMHRPWITLKWAQSADGFIDRRREKFDDGPAVKFSTAWTQTLVHRLRSMHQAIVVGRRTWELDRPSLTTRLWPGASPARFVLTSSPMEIDSNAETASSIDALLATLYERGMQSLLVEGGAATLQAFIDSDLWDEAYIEKTNMLLGDGIRAPKIERNLKGRAIHVNFAQ